MSNLFKKRGLAESKANLNNIIILNGIDNKPL